MLCEKCKNKKPTVFFTDNSGINHSLCAACAATYTQAPHITQTADTPEVMLIPRSCLTKSMPYVEYISCNVQNNKICENCKVPYADIIKNGEFGCAVCACDIFDTSQKTHRMPRRIKLRIRRQEELEALKTALSALLSREDYEGAAAVRDKIRKLQGEL